MRIIYIEEVFKRGCFQIKTNDKIVIHCTVLMRFIVKVNTIVLALAGLNSTHLEFMLISLKLFFICWSLNLGRL